MKPLAAAALGLTLVACSGAPTRTAPPAAQRAEAGSAGTRTQPRRSPYAPAREDLSKRGNYVAGGLYAPDIKDSAPDGLPDVDLIPEPEVRAEPRSLYGNRSPYTVLGKTYRVLDDPAGYDEVGLASFYGNKFHGRRTSNLEVYDMYAFTAAHKTLPLPSYARVTNLANGKSVVVRVNDRGPFHDGRIIDLSYAAAVKLGVDRAGTARVEVRGLAPGEGDGGRVAAAPSDPAPATTAAAPSAIDQLVAALPIAAATAAERPLPASPTPATVAGDGAGFAATPPAVPAGNLVLQVASYGERANAERALSRLRAAGIANARIEDAFSNGRPVWRLRIGPVAAATVPELVARVTGLGFGRPQPVRE